MRPSDSSSVLNDRQDKKIAGARHRNATTTVEMRRFIQTSNLGVQELAKLLNITPATVRKWKQRDSVSDSPNTPHHLNTTLTQVEEYVVVGLRYQLKLTLDKLLEVTQSFINPHVSRSGLARCLKRHGVSRLGDIEPNGELPDKHFNKLPVYRGSNTESYTLNTHTLAQALALPSEDEQTVVQVEAMRIPVAADQPHSVLIGMDPSHDWVYVDIYTDTDTEAANRYMAHVLANGPFSLRKVLARNYQTFLERFPDADGTKAHTKTPAPSAPSGEAS
ncbi:transcriptional regulator [Shewanella cyperi]|uniref:transcriptional regulator n=1 Tax=Shewanella cyperi TaxID=2814292 RepID=UPI00396A8FFE